MMSVGVDSKWGGSGMDALSYAIAMEEISRGCASTGVIMSAHNSLYCSPVENYGTDEQKEKFLSPVTSGEFISTDLNTCHVISRFQARRLAASCFRSLETAAMQEPHRQPLWTRVITGS
jgi:hypothetical protein